MWGSLGTFYCGFVAFLLVIICPCTEMEKDPVDLIYQQLTWKKRLKIFHMSRISLSE